MLNPAPHRTRGRARGKALTTLGLIAALSLAATQPAAAAFTTLVVVGDAQSATAATLFRVSNAEGSRGPGGEAHVSWLEPSTRLDVEPNYLITRSIDGVEEALGIVPDHSSGSARITDDLTVSATVDGLAASTVSSGTVFSCAVAAGNGYCWGRGSSGQLGNGSLGPGLETTEPVAVTGALSGKTITMLNAGYTHACAVADAAAYCWGHGGFGKLGNASGLNQASPVAVSTQPGALQGKTVTAIDAGENHTCAVASGAVYCWGYAALGQLGNNSSTQSNVPVQVDVSGVLNGLTVTAIALGAAHSCAIADGDVYCWGSGGHGQLGNGDTADSSVPVAVDSSAWGETPVDAIGAGHRHTCAIAGGSAYCWGNGGRGQLGNSGYANSPTPVAVNTTNVPGGAPFSAITGGASSTCAIAGERAYCWGLNVSYGQLGWVGGSTSSIPVPVDASAALAGKTITSIGTGYTHSCVVGSQTPYCWGQSLGDGGATAGPLARIVPGVFASFTCATNWLLVDTDRCAPGEDAIVQYEIDYTKAGWSPGSTTLVTTSWETP